MSVRREGGQKVKDCYLSYIETAPPVEVLAASHHIHGLRLVPHGHTARVVIAVSHAALEERGVYLCAVQSQRLLRGVNALVLVAGGAAGRGEVEVVGALEWMDG
jgi:hypothetical protein